MASPVKKTYLLITILTYFIHPNAGYTLVSGIPVSANSAVPPRLELRTFIQDSTRLNIFYLALERMHATPTSNLLSYYRIAGIHGANYAWDGDTGGNYPDGYGYCHHGDRLFPTWHRPYLALFEKTLYDLATTIVNAFSNGTVKDRHLLVLSTWRMPYWDWAMDPSLPSIMSSTTRKNVTVTKMVNGQLTNVIIPNPLYSYRFPVPNEQSIRIPQPSGQKSGQTLETVRSPATVQVRINGVRTNVYTSRPSISNNDMIAEGPGLKESVANVFENARDYNSFSNYQEGGDSIEGVHGTVHVITGDEGHLTFIELAGYEVLFYLHHANIDRLFALWQVINPNSYLTNSSSQFPNANTPLYPFRRTQTEYWTSESVRATTAFGYTYPEQNNATEASVIATLNLLYNANITPSGRKRKRQTTDTDSVSLNKRDATNPDTDDDRILETYTNYVVRMRVPNNIAKRSCLIKVFFAEYALNGSNCAENCYYVGSFGIFTARDLPASHKKIVKGRISLTKALRDRYDAGQLKGMDRKTIKEYVQRNIQCVIKAGDSPVVDSDEYHVDIDEEEMVKRKNQLPSRRRSSNIYKLR